MEPVDRTEHKVYKGFSYTKATSGPGWIRSGTARVAVHRDGSDPMFEGVFRIDGNSHHVQSLQKYRALKHVDDPEVQIEGDGKEAETMVVWRDSDLSTFQFDHGELKRSVSNDSRCDSNLLDFNAKLDDAWRRNSQLRAVESRSLFGRQSIDGGSSGGDAPGIDLKSTIGSTGGCPTTRKVALVGIATDCTYWKGFDSKEEDLRKNVIGMVNLASEVYENTFQISLGIQNLTISDEGCPGTASESAPWNVDCGNGVDISDRLSLFSAWRGQFEDTNAYWTLLTTCATEAAVGLAWRGQLCRKGSGDSHDSSGNNETVAGANVVVKTDTEWQVFAHESGHTFGAFHDCAANTCPSTSATEVCCPLTASTCDANGKFIMNPSTGPGITAFSACSIGNICSGLKGIVDATCLTGNKNVDTITGSQCGNGIVETGEDCDCGGDQSCQNNSCCDAKTCKFKTGAVCDPTNEDCCSDKCQFTAAGTVCRASTGECDLQETCPGDAANCPMDKHKDDGDSCGNSGDGLQCASGQCSSRDLQCRNMISGLGTSNNTGACDGDDSCVLTCKSPDYGPNQCVSYNQNFLDGTSCGAGGHCSSGSCEGSSTAKEIRNWILNHKQIVIPVASVIGLLILLAVISCCVSCFRRRRPVPKRQPPPPVHMREWPQRDGQWGGEHRSRGPPGSSAQQNYQYSSVPEEYGGQWAGPNRSMRYA